jgi:hypothetical protein
LFFFIFFHFDLSYFMSAYYFFHFFFQIEQFKLFWNHHLKLYKSFCNFKGNKIIFKDFLRGLKIGYELFDREISVKMNPPTLGGCNILTFSPFFPNFSAIDVQRRRFHLCFGHHKILWNSLTKSLRNLILSVLWLASLP